MKTTYLALILVSVVSASPLKFDQVTGAGPADSYLQVNVGRRNLCVAMGSEIDIDERICSDQQGRTVDGVGLIPPAGVTCRETGNKEGINLSADICVCIKDGRITVDAAEAIATALSPQNPIINQLLLPANGAPGPYLDLTSVFDAASANMEAQLQYASSKCVYPEGATPNQCGGCGFSCPDGKKKCGDQCIPNDQSCVSNVPGKRNVVECPGSLTACAIPGTSFTSRNFECIDTTSDFESCGACAFPLPGQPFGQDCTTIPHTAAVDCVRGSCRVHTCKRGYEVDSTNSSCTPIVVGTTLFNGKTAMAAAKLITQRQVKMEKLRTRK